MSKNVFKSITRFLYGSGTVLLLVGMLLSTFSQPALASSNNAGEAAVAQSPNTGLKLAPVGPLNGPVLNQGNVTGASLSFTSGCSGDCYNVSATVCNTGDGDMVESVSYEVLFAASGNPKNGSVVGSGSFGPLSAGDCTRLDHSPSASGNYMFKASQESSHPGQGELYSGDCSVTMCVAPTNTKIPYTSTPTEVPPTATPTEIIQTPTKTKKATFTPTSVVETPTYTPTGVVNTATATQVAETATATYTATSIVESPTATATRTKVTKTPTATTVVETATPVTYTPTATTEVETATPTATEPEATPTFTFTPTIAKTTVTVESTKVFETETPTPTATEPVNEETPTATPTITDSPKDNSETPTATATDSPKDNSETPTATATDSPKDNSQTPTATATGEVSQDNAPTATTVPTLAAPDPGPQAQSTPVLIPVTGIDLTSSARGGLGGLFTNLGLMILGFAMLMTGVTNRLK